MERTIDYDINGIEIHSNTNLYVLITLFINKISPGESFLLTNGYYGKITHNYTSCKYFKNKHIDCSKAISRWGNSVP